MIARMMSLAVTPVARPAVDRDPQRPGLALPERLRRQHVRDLGGADAEGERAERAVRRRVAVAADDQHAGLAQALLRGRPRARCPGARRRGRRGGCRRARSRRSSACAIARFSGIGDGVESRGCRSARSGRASRRRDPACARRGRAGAASRRPAPNRPAPGGGRRRAGSWPSSRLITTWRAQILSKRVRAAAMVSRASRRTAGRSTRSA